MTFSVSITKRVRKRKLISGAVATHVRYVLNYRNPKSGHRRQEFFERQKDAHERKTELILKVADGAPVDERQVPTVSKAVDHWLADKEQKVKPNTLDGYKVVVAH